jgi:hypothetical protein
MNAPTPSTPLAAEVLAGLPLMTLASHRPVVLLLNRARALPGGGR